MRFSSIGSVLDAAVLTLRRFPVPLACAWGACAIFDLLILTGGDHPRALAFGLMAALGLPTCFALTLLAERFPGGRSVRWLPHVAALLALGALALGWPRWSEEIQVRRFVQLSLFAHALASFLPYLPVREPNGFWQYNRALLERFILASIFAGVLLAGLEGALASLKPLFGIRVPEKAFLLLATWVGLGFHPWFFLAGIPADLRALEERRDYPGTVRVFAQFILVPLVAIYQVLLSAYLLKVIVTGKWPSGLIGVLVSAEAVAGILAILLVHPVRERAENLWVRTFARGFYIALVPSIVMLAMSIAKRVGQYGVTEDRYFVIALTVWLGAISAFFIARRDGDIRWIPVTLAALALLTFGGPWGAYEVSLASQRARFLRALEASGLWSDGRLVPPGQPVAPEHRKQLSAGLAYLLGHHGGASLAPILGPTLAAADSGLDEPDRTRGVPRAQRVAAKMGFVFMNSWEGVHEDKGAFSFARDMSEPRPAQALVDMDYHVQIDDLYSSTFLVGSRTVALSCDEPGHRLVLAETRGDRGGRAPTTPLDTLATGSLDSLVAQVRRLRVAGEPLPRVRLEGRGAHGFLAVTGLRGRDRPAFTVYSLSGDLFLTLRGAKDDRAR